MGANFTQICASPPGPLSNSAASPLRGEGEKSLVLSGSPSPRNEVKLERGLGGEALRSKPSTGLAWLLL